MRKSLKLAKEYGDYWQKILRLQSWIIEYSDIKKKGIQAYIDAIGHDQEDSHIIENRKACMEINFSEIDTKEELKKVILHEMIHVLLCPISIAPRTNTDTIAMEQVVTTIEEAIWNGYLQTGGKE